MKKWILSFLLFTRLISAEPTLPVDLTFLIADIKYSQVDGVKVCEVQHGSLSAFKGDLFINKGKPVIPHRLMETLSLYVSNGWATKKSVADFYLKDLFVMDEIWQVYKSSRDIFDHESFQSLAHRQVYDPMSIFDYHGCVYLKTHSADIINSCREKFPGIIFIDAAAVPLWMNKEKVSEIFLQDSNLQKIKPKWEAYPAVYRADLADRIVADFECDRFVIKPKGEFLGRGVIIVSKEDLDATLRYILRYSSTHKNDSDPVYAFWRSSNQTSFIIEKFYSSDPIRVPHLENQLFQPTIRVAYLFAYTNGNVYAHFLGSYCQLPKKSLEESGTLNEKHKSYCKIPYYSHVAPELEAQIVEELEIPMKLFYQKMLEQY